MKLNLFVYAVAFLALLLTACDKAQDDVIPKSFQELALQNDAYVTQAGQPVLLSILANDYITGPAQITVAEPHNGTLAPGPEVGQYIYHPDSAFTGTENFTYTACIGTICKTAQVSITVSAIPCTVVAYTDYDTTQFNTPVEIDVLANDFLCGNSSQITLEAGIGTIREMITITNDNKILFTPQDGFYGVAGFSYRISNATSQATGMVKVLVRQPITQLCADLVANPDMVQLSTGLYQPPFDLKAFAVQNDQICDAYPYTFEVLSNPYYGYTYSDINGSDTTYYYQPYTNSQGYEYIYYRLRQQLPTTEVETPPTQIKIILTP